MTVLQYFKIWEGKTENPLGKLMKMPRIQKEKDNIFIAGTHSPILLWIEMIAQMLDITEKTDVPTLESHFF